MIGFFLESSSSSNVLENCGGKSQKAREKGGCYCYSPNEIGEWSKLRSERFLENKKGRI